MKVMFVNSPFNRFATKDLFYTLRKEVNGFKEILVGVLN
jgi:hypothetical protein